MFCLCKIADVNPISTNRFVKPKTNITIAIKPKSVLSKKRVKTDIFSNWVTTKEIDETVVHFTPDMACFFMLKLCYNIYYISF